MSFKSGCEEVLDEFPHRPGFQTEPSLLHDYISLLVEFAEDWIEKFAIIHDHVSAADMMYNELLRRKQKTKAVYFATVLSSLPDTEEKMLKMIAKEDETYISEMDLSCIITENKDNPAILENMESIKKLEKMLSEIPGTIAVIKEKAKIRINNLTSDDLTQPSIFEWHGNSVLSSLLYNIRHIMLHIGALNLRLHRKGEKLDNWVTHQQI